MRVDKFCRRCFEASCAFQFALLFAFAWLFGIVSPLAQNNGWSFENFPHPQRSQWSQSETAKVSDIMKILPFEARCGELVSVQYQLYNNHYPGFGQSGSGDANYLDWKSYIVTTEEDVTSLCVFLIAFEELAGLIAQPTQADFFYCGAFSRPPANQQETEIARSVEQLVQLSKANPVSGAVNFLTIALGREFIELNLDVEYYFSRLLEPYLDTDERIPELINLEPNISQQRKAFVEQAALNHDLQSVLDTTKSCASPA